MAGVAAGAVACSTAAGSRLSCGNNYSTSAIKPSRTGVNVKPTCSIGFSSAVYRPDSLSIHNGLQAGMGFTQFDGLRGLVSRTSLYSSAIISRKAPALSVKASSAVIETPTAVAAAPSKQKIRIRLKSYWVPRIEKACLQILEAAKTTNAVTMGPVPLPTKRRIYCLLRSPHVDKDSREHFEIRTHIRLIELSNPNAQTIDALMQLDLPAGVDVQVKLQ